MEYEINLFYRIIADCKSYINGDRNPAHLWAKTPQDEAKLLQHLYNFIPKTMHSDVSDADIQKYVSALTGGANGN